MTLLGRIGELKRQGYSLPEIKKALEKDIARAEESDADLAGLEDARVRAAILEVASDEFMANGYRGTHVMAIIQKLGINPHIFYRHFPSKLDLLLDCFVASSPIPIGSDIPAPDDDLDPGQKTLRGLTQHDRWHYLSAALQQAVRSEGSIEPETAGRLAKVWDALMANVVRDIQRARNGRPDDPAISDELLAYALIGAHRTPRVRASWDDKFSTAELIRAHLFVVFALMDALSGKGDAFMKVAAYEDEIQNVAARMPVLPPAL